MPTPVAAYTSLSGLMTSAAHAPSASLDLGSGSNRVVYICIRNNTGGNDGAASAPTIGGSASTLVGPQTPDSVAYYTVYRYIGPPTGSSTVAVPMTYNYQDYNAWIIVLVIEGVDQTTPNDTLTLSDEGYLESPSVDVTSASGDLAVGFFGVEANTTYTAGTGETVDGQIALASGGGISNVGTAAIVTEAGAATVTLAPSSGLNNAGCYYWNVKAAAGGTPYTADETEGATFDAADAEALATAEAEGVGLGDSANYPVGGPYVVVHVAHDKAN